jgi:hypothetical protein
MTTPEDLLTFDASYSINVCINEESMFWYRGNGVHVRGK